MKIAHLFFLILATVPAVVTKAETVTIVESDPWDSIKDFTYEKRVEFAAGTGKLVERLDNQVRKLNEKRATLPQTSVKDWDFAMSELTAARAYLASTIDDLGNATVETWDEAKDRVGKAWRRSQDAYDKVKSSTTT